MSLAFWSVTVAEGKPTEVQPPEGYVLNLQQAALEGGVEKHSVLIKVSTVSIEEEDINAVIGTLRSGHTDQLSLGLVFGYEVPVTFTVAGKGTVHLSGYYQPGT